MLKVTVNQLFQLSWKVDGPKILHIFKDETKFEYSFRNLATFNKKWKAKMALKPGDEWCMRPEEDVDILY